MRLFTRFLLGLLLVLGVPAAAWATTFTVIVRDFAYSPQFLTIAPGDQVTFQWESGNHPTVSDNNAFDGFAMSSASRTKTLVFNSAGAFPYHCSAHGSPGVGMFGTITVSALTPVQRAQAPEAALQLYPNPAKGGAVTLTVPGAVATADYKLRITNIIGREVRVVSLRASQLSNGQPLNLSDLPAGLYLCSVLQQDRVVSTRRLVLQN